MFFIFLHEGAHVKTDINNDLIPALENSNLEKTYITKHLGTDQKMIDLIIRESKRGRKCKLKKVNQLKMQVCK